MQNRGVCACANKRGAAYCNYADLSTSFARRSAPVVISLVGLPTSVLVMDVEGEEKDRGKKRVRTKGIQKKLLEQVGASNIS